LNKILETDTYPATVYFFSHSVIMTVF